MARHSRALVRVSWPPTNSRPKKPSRKRSIASASSPRASRQAAADERAHLALLPVPASDESISTSSRNTLDPGSAEIFQQVLPQPEVQLRPDCRFPTRRSRTYYDADPASDRRCSPRRSPACRSRKSLEEMVEEVDAIWLGDASGTRRGPLRPGRARAGKGLPTFCDKPIGGTVAGTRKILEFARKHNAPLMSSSLFRHEWGMEEALRMNAIGRVRRAAITSSPAGRAAHAPAAGSSTASIRSGRWMTLCGPGVEAVSMYARENACHALITYPDRMPAEVWYGRPDTQASTARRRSTSRRRATTSRRPSRATSGSATTTRCSAWPRRSARCDDAA